MITQYDYYKFQDLVEELMEFPENVFIDDIIGGYKFFHRKKISAFDFVYTNLFLCTLVHDDNRGEVFIKFDMLYDAPNGKEGMFIALSNAEKLLIQEGGQHIIFKNTMRLANVEA